MAVALVSDKIKCARSIGCIQPSSVPPQPDLSGSEFSYGIKHVGAMLHVGTTASSVLSWPFLLYMHFQYRMGSGNLAIFIVGLQCSV
jgi:hypothetical protein